jgi:hypothetical protein
MVAQGVVDATVDAPQARVVSSVGTGFAKKVLVLVELKDKLRAESRVT